MTASAMTVAQAAPLMPQRGMRTMLSIDVGGQAHDRRQEQPAIEIRRDGRRVENPGAEDEQRAAREDLQRADGRRVAGAEQQR